MIIIITGQKSSGKSIALEILQKENFQVFNFGLWLQENTQFNTTIYNMIKNSDFRQFIDQKKVLLEELKDWIKTKTNETERLNLKIKLNNILLPIIKRKLIELKKTEKIIFVEFDQFLSHKIFFNDVYEKVIYIIRKKEKFCDKFPSNWFILNNENSITEFKKNLLIIVDQIFPKE